MIITIYKADGTKERRPVGYSGNQCNAATRPYEKREIPGSVKKTPTLEGSGDHVTKTAVTEQIKVR